MTAVIERTAPVHGTQPSVLNRHVTSSTTSPGRAGARALTGTSCPPRTTTGRGAAKYSDETSTRSRAT